MPSIPTPDDVFNGIITRLKGDSGFSTYAAGGAHFQRRAAGKEFPYLVLTIEEREPDYADSSGSYLQAFVVEISVWVQSKDQVAAQTGPARIWLDGLLNWTPDDPANGVAVPNAVQTMWVKPVGGSLKLSPELRRGQDVLTAGKRVEVAIEGNNRG